MMGMKLKIHAQQQAPWQVNFIPLAFCSFLRIDPADVANYYRVLVRAERKS